MERLSIGAETLLKEIISHHNVNNNSDTAYWRTRFENMSYDENFVIRSQFQELEEQRMISVFWADNIPAEIQLLNNGWAYEADCKRQEKDKQSEQKSEFWRTLIVGVISAIIGVIVGKII